MSSVRQEPIAVIGSACRFPGGSDTPSKLWELLREPRDLLQKIPPRRRFNPEAFFHSDPEHHGTTNVKASYLLDEDPAEFDNAFFNIQPAECEAIDPQQRMLMETVYESICSAGQTLEGLRGSSTAVIVGTMCDDWSGMLYKDLETIPQYSATGMSRSIMANRVSYFFDWHGPSMTLDTACSSSLVAIHLAIQALRNGESRVAVAAGANLLLSPGMYVAEANLHMLSPTGKSRMWDQDVDGYARGEGIAAVVLKPLSAALDDGDHIECLIRATGVNQDGRTQGLTMPSAAAQAALIRETYRRAGLDITKPEDRPQFFHAHGTGTPAGDPQEADAISRAFYRECDGAASDKLYVGSIKTIIGHTEGTAGLASLIGTSLALQHGVIPPNMHFKTLNPKIAPFYSNLEVPTSAKPWPELLPGQPRRASVNSFGFGGTNAHAIIEAYDRPSTSPSTGPLFTPLVMSAASEKSLRSLLASYSTYLKTNPNVSIRDFAFTLQERRSTLSYRAAIAASTTQEAWQKIDALLGSQDSPELTTRHFGVQSPRILGIFTGQGAQWPRMGAKLIEASPFMGERLDELDSILGSLPGDVRPNWTLRQQILADIPTSRVTEAAISQPLCTAVQILLVDLLRLTGIQLDAVVGHSSGEIGASYAAGLLSASAALRIAFYRGLYAKLAGSSSSNGSGRGAMMAVGTSLGDASEFCQLDEYSGRIQVAAVNSSSSITLSGDEDAVVQAVEIFKDEGKFARQLKVDTAYHSTHMLPCAAPYLSSMEGIDFTETFTTDISPVWYSSVLDGMAMTPKGINAQYWVDNMTNPVLFASAVTEAARSGPFNFVLEIGPHPALKGPCLDTLKEAFGDPVPYSGLLARGKDDILEFSTALGLLWSHLGAGSVSFETFEKTVSKEAAGRHFVPDLPQYPFDHSRSYWTVSRAGAAQSAVHVTPHPLLGRRCVDRETSQGIQWRNILSPKEISWLKGHKIQGQIVFPAAGFVALAVEAIKAMAKASSISLIKIENLDIGRAIAFDDENSSVVEFILSLDVVHSGESYIEAKFSCCSGSPHEVDVPMALNAQGVVTATLADAEADSIPFVQPNDFNMTEIEVERFYDQFTRLEYEYSPPFRGMASIKRKHGHAIGTIEDQSGSDWEDQLLIHPGLLDTAFQSSSAAFSCPGDGAMWGLYIPAGIQSIVINTFYLSSERVGSEATYPWEAVSRSMVKGRSNMDINIFSPDNCHTFVQVEGLELMPFTAALPQNDTVMFSRFDYKIDRPNGITASLNDELTEEGMANAIEAERISFYYLRRLVETITPEEKANTLPYYQHLLTWASNVVNLVKTGKNPHVPSTCQRDTEEQIKAILDGYGDRVDVRLIESVGKSLPDVVRSRTSILEHMEGLFEFYDQGLGLDMANRHLARMVTQVGHRYPRMKVFEIGAGTGGSTRTILSYLGDSFSSYTYTDISSGFFEAAQDRFRDGRMIFKTYDMERPPASQGFIPGSYDLVVASNVLHATDKLEEMLKNARQLLKPGGYLIALELTNNDTMRVGMPMGALPGWWVGAKTGRPMGPTVTLPQWDALLRKSGFGGIDTSTPIFNKLHVSAIFAAQAVDDRVSLLRSPLASITALPPSDAPRLVIVGGNTLTAHKITERAAVLLSSRFQDLVRVPSFENLDAETLSYSSTVLSITELDEPLFENITPAKLNALKALWHRAGKILWVTRGARSDQPFSSMTLGLGRAMTHEYPNISLQVLDLDSVDDEEKTARILVEELLRLEVLKKWENEAQGDEEMLWSIEPEVYFESGMRLIPRLCQCEPANERYNSTRRKVSRMVSAQESHIIFVADGSSYELQQASPLCVASSLPGRVGKSRTLQISHFLLQTISVDSFTRVMFCLGTDESTGERVLALSHTTESRPTVPMEWTVLLPENSIDPVSALSAVAAYAMARNILQLVLRGCTLVVHEPDDLVASAFSRLSDQRRVQLVITTSIKEQAAKGWRYIPGNLSRRLIKEALPANTSVFVNLSLAPESAKVGRLVDSCISPSCATYSSKYFYGVTTEVRPGFSLSEISDILKAAWLEVNANRSQVTHVPPTVQLQNMTGLSIAEKPLKIVDCASPDPILVNIQPIDSGVIFRPDRTYFLVGLSGQVGQSLCRWMVEHGARFVVLTSRSPKVHPKFIQSMEAIGASLRVLPLTMPPIGGVAQGAMVLEDSMFDGLEFDKLTRVLDPKVTGTQLLDELFYNDTSLDFFVVMSSLTSVVGNSGQSNYTAANMFMVALAEQRRKRGVVGSAMAISSLIGIGYVERSEDFTGDYFEKIGYRNISERDLHQLFAEAILVGRPGCAQSSEVVTGLEPFYPERNAKAQFFDDIRFNHFILERQEVHSLGGKVSALAIRVQLAEAKTRDEASAIIKEGFLARLRRTLMMSQDDHIDDKASLVEQGIDSLMAVEVRAWFLKELEFDVPVLKILGGSSITELLTEAMERVPSSVVDLDALDTSAKSFAPENVGPNPQDTQVSTNDTSSSSSSSASDRVDTHSRSTTPLQTPPTTDIGGPVIQSPTVKDDPKASSVGTKLGGNSAREEASEMSYGQARFWFLSDYLANKKSLNMTVMFKLSGKVQSGRLENAVRTVASRHEALRTRFFWSGEGDGRVPMQGVLSEPLVRLDHRRIGSEADAKEELRRMHDHTWDLNSWEPARMSLLSLDDDVHYFLVGGHHISWDGYSFSVLFVDIDAAYHGRLSPQLGLESQYRSFALWQREAYEAGEMKKSIEEYYRPMIDPHAKAIPLFSFAKSPTRPLLDDFAQFEAKAWLQPDLVSKLKQVARKQGATMFHLYLAALQALVFRLLPDEDDFYLGIADANRLDKRFMGSLGFFLNLLPVRFKRSPRGTKVSDVIKDTRNKAYKALEHSFVPWNVLLHELKIQRTNTEAPIFQLFVDYRQMTRERSEWCGCKLSDEDWLNARNGYDLTLGITDNPTGDSFLSLRFQQKLYSESSTDLFMRSYVNVLETFAQGVDLDVNELPPWAPRDVETALEAGKGPTMELTWPATISHRIDQMMEEHSTKPALKDGLGSSLTYADTRDRVNSIASRLLEAGVSEGSPIGICQDPSADWICSMLAVFKVGAVYVPLDFRNSASRLASIVEIVEPVVLLTDSSTTSKVDLIQGAHAHKVVEICVSDIRHSTTSITNKAKPESPAVILFTSGTTGKPKGVVLTHANLRAQCEGYSRFCDIPSKAKMVLQQTIYNFDVSLDQIFAALADGGCLYVVPADKRGDPQAITKLMAEHHVTYTVATPSEYETWFRYAPESLALCKSWQYAFGGGEHLHSGLIHEFANLARQHIPGLRLFNNYGPTEASLAITKGEVKHSEPGLEDHVPAGFILPNYAVAVVDEHLKPVPCEASGEIVAGGPGVGAGYLGLEKMTREKFIPGSIIHPLAAESSNTWYRTGDRGRLRQDGTLYVDGRIAGDSQVKIRGFRVELGEIEAVLLENSKGALSHAVVTARGTGEDRFLAAHVVFAPDYPLHCHQSLITRLESKLPLPPYMQPAVIIPLAKIPVTSNFKFDRKAIQVLPLPDTSASSGVIDLSSLAEIEKTLAQLWQNIIPHRIRELTPETNFFDVGGNSILLVKLKAAVRKALNASPLLIDLMNSSTLGGMARIVRGSVVTHVIDWETETIVPETLLAGKQAYEANSRSKKDQNLTVIMAGATGFLGRHVLTRLIERPEVGEIRCLVRKETLSSMEPLPSPKIHLVPADLSQPNLGLSLTGFNELSKDADIIVNCAANRSFWDGYATLRAVNVDAVKDLARLCLLANNASLHMVSSGAVQIYGGITPPTDGSDGYVATKWAAETFLRKASSSTGLQVHIYRPLPMPMGDDQHSLSTSGHQHISIQDELVDIVRKLGRTPDFEILDGYVDVAPMDEVVQEIVTSMINRGEWGVDNGGGDRVLVTDHRGHLRLHIEVFARHIASDVKLKTLPRQNPLLWFADAKKAGFKHLITSQHLVMRTKDGELVVKR